MRLGESPADDSTPSRWAPGGAWGRWRPIALAVSVLLVVPQLLGTLGATEHQPERHDVDALAIIIVVAGPLSLYAMARHTRPVLWFIAGITAIYLVRGYAYGPVFISLALAVVVAVVLGYRYAAWAAMGAVVLVHFIAILIVAGEAWSWTAFFGVAAWALLVVAIAELVRMRQERIVAARRSRAELQRSRANEERLRIAHELHDVVAHHISLINVQAGVALHIGEPERVYPALNVIKDASAEALTELRSLVRILRDDVAEAPRAPASRLDSFDELIERGAHAGLEIDTRIEGQRRQLPAAVELAAYRIIQESITNVVRHAGAHSARITLEYHEDEFVVHVTDDGQGMDTPGDGSGIHGMRERATALGGNLDVSHAPAGGVHVRASFPVGESR